MSQRTIFSLAVPILLTAFTASADEFGEAIQQLVNAAGTNFKDVRDDASREVDEDGDIVYSPKIRVPGARSTRIVYYKDPKKRPLLSITFFLSEKDAVLVKDKFEELKESMRTGLGRDWHFEDRNDDDDVRFQAMSRKDGTMAWLTLSKYTSGRSTLRLTIFPSAKAKPKSQPEPLTAAESVRLDEENLNVKWNTDGREPWVSFKFPYKNIGDKAVKCTIRIATGHKPRDAEDNDNSEWEEKYHQTFDLTLGPGETKTITGRLNWFRRGDTMPTLRHPNPNETSETFLKATFAE